MIETKHRTRLSIILTKQVWNFSNEDVKKWALLGQHAGQGYRMWYVSSEIDPKEVYYVQMQ